MKQEEFKLMVEAFIRMLSENGFLVVEVDVKVFDSDVTLHHINKVHKEIYNSQIYKKIKEKMK